MVDILDEIKVRFYEKLETTSIDCPECDGMYEYESYQCVTCGAEGGDGKIPLSKLISNFCLNKPSYKRINNERD